MTYPSPLSRRARCSLCLSRAPVKESSLLALPESSWLRTDGIAKGSTIAALARLSNKLARDGSAKLKRMLWRRSEGPSVTAWAGGMIYPSPLSRRARCSLFLSCRGVVPTALPRAPPSLLQTACSIACDYVAQLSASAILDHLADCSVRSTTRLTTCSSNLVLPQRLSSGAIVSTVPLAVLNEGWRPLPTRACQQA